MSGSIIKAPWHLWVVGGLSLLWNAFGCFDFTMTATNNADYLASYPQELRDYWMDMPVWVWAIWAIGVFGSLFGSIALLLRRDIARSTESFDWIEVIFALLMAEAPPP